MIENKGLSYGSPFGRLWEVWERHSHHSQPLPRSLPHLTSFFSYTIPYSHHLGARTTKCLDIYIPYRLYSFCGMGGRVHR